MERVDLLAAEHGRLAGLEHDDVEARRGEHAGRRATARAGADDADVAVESQLAVGALGRERQARRGVLERARVADATRAPGRPK